MQGLQAYASLDDVPEAPDLAIIAVDAEKDHHRHAIVEQVIADLKSGPLAHMPSGDFQANAASRTGRDHPQPDARPRRCREGHRGSRAPG